MRKYSEQLKLLVVKDYMSGTGGYKLVAEKHQVNVASLRAWVASYRGSGIEGIKDKNQRARFTIEFKLSVLKRMKDEKLSQRQAAALFNIRKFDAIGEWESQYAKNGVNGLLRKNKAVKKMKKTSKKSIDTKSLVSQQIHEQLLKEIDALRMENAYLKKLEALVQKEIVFVQQQKRKSFLN
jgi:transposase